MLLGMGSREPKLLTYCTRHFFERLWMACTKTFTAELVDVYTIMLGFVIDGLILCADIDKYPGVVSPRNRAFRAPQLSRIL